jgi:hypothetical protein
MTRLRLLAFPALLMSMGAVSVRAQVKVQQSASSFSYTVKGDEFTIEITNVAYEVTDEKVPGRPPEERLQLRKTAHSKRVLGDIGEEATTKLEAWPLGADLKQKPIYSVTTTGTDGRTVDGALWVASRAVEEMDWWSVYKLGTGQHLFDTYLPLLQFSISRENVEMRYVGLEVPPDDAADARLKEPHVVGVVSYASAEKVIREALLTCDSADRASLLRSYADFTRSMSVVDGPGIRISFSQNYPSKPATVSVQIPVASDTLDLTHAQLPAGLHLAAWRR